MNIKFRKSIKEDIPFINELFIEMVKTVNEKMISEGIKPYENLDSGYEKGYLDNFYLNDDKVIFVALDNEKIIGFISVCNEKEYIYLDDYSVSEKYRGKKIGSKLMEMAFEHALYLGIYDILTHVESANKSSIAFYTKKGFDIVEMQGHRLLIKKNLQNIKTMI